MQFDTTMADIGPSHGPSWAAPSAAAVAAAVSPSRRSTLRSAKRPRSPSPVASQQPTNKRAMFARNQHRRASSGERAELLARTHSLSIKSSEELVFTSRPSKSTQPPSRTSSAMDVDPMMTDSPPPRPTVARRFGAGLIGDVPQLQLVIPDKPQTSSAGTSAPTVTVAPSDGPQQPQRLQLPVFTSSMFEPSRGSMPVPSASLMVPRINIQPATPDSLSRATSLAPPSPLVATSPANSTWNSTASPVGGNSMAWIPASPSTITRRRTLTMGPRADCEKCRLGVKGHSMHFD